MHQGVEHPFWFFLLGTIAAAITVFMYIPALRKNILTPMVFDKLKTMLPTIGETEQVALEAGTVWWDKELFSGQPQWKDMMAFPIAPLSQEEQAFMDGPVEELCGMLDDFAIMQRWDLTEDTWQFLKDHKFFGMIIPKEYGGLGFSAQAHSAVVAKLASRSTSAAVTVMVPNSLGPAELLLHYGTQAQKDYYLPRLATGEEIPCFGLTEPNAGSDAGGMQSRGVICKGTYEGKEVLGIQLNWEKRWITLSPIATVIGLAFLLEDPDGLIGDKKHLGITCALVPSNLEGVNIGQRHNPLMSSFKNGPTWGKDVFIPLDAIIGGVDRAGQGWKMLMESLAAGRSISLPALSSAQSKVALRVAHNHACIREQFGLSIVRFEGVEEKLTPIAGLNYVLEGARNLTCGAVDAGEFPSVISAVMKAYSTETSRKILNDAMDIRAGNAITLGPKNVLGNMYIAAPIGITVEGANILTRTLIIFGQGAIRCHPHIQNEIKAIGQNDLDLFDRSFWGHVGLSVRNGIRAMLLSLTNGHLEPAPGNQHSKRVLQQLSRYSACFAVMSDTAMGVLGGALKRKEKLSGRMADALSWMYLTTATVKHYMDQGQPENHRAVFLWSTQYGLYQIQQALLGVLDNFPVRPIAWALKLLFFPLGRAADFPSDTLGHHVVESLRDPSLRDFLTKGIYMPDAQDPGLGHLEHTYQAVMACYDIQAKIKEAIAAGTLNKKSSTLLEDAVAATIITPEEKQKLDGLHSLKQEAIRVNDYKDQKEMQNHA